jgi:exosortase/archaeosortase family protein
MIIQKEDLNDTQEKLYDTLVFLVKLIAAGAVFRAILWIYPDTQIIQAFFAEFIAAMLNSTGLETVTQGIYISIKETPYVITQDCLGWKSLAAFTGLVYASTKRTLEHLNFILQGFAIIIIANIIRVYTTVLLAEKEVISFSIIHDVLWSWSLTLLVLIIWAYWFTKMKDSEPLFQKKIKEQAKELRKQ